MRLISLYTYLNDVGGAQNLCVTLHNELMKTEVFREGKVSSFTDYETLAPVYKKQVSPETYIKFKAYTLIQDGEKTIFLSHHRKMTTYLIGLSKLLRKEITIVHVAHITLESLKYVSLFPKYTIAVSKKVAQNLKEYFNVNNVEVIYNGVSPVKYDLDKKYHPNSITITLPASIDSRKQQLVLVEYLKDKLPKQITIQFAGEGPDIEKLKALIAHDKQFKVLGHVENMQSLYKTTDYVLLFSKSEGLPLSLIEAQSYGIPIICNDVGGSLEILNPDVNGFFTDSLPELLECLSNLPEVDVVTYEEMREHSLENFKNNFPFDQMIQKYTAYLKEVIKLENY